MRILKIILLFNMIFSVSNNIFAASPGDVVINEVAWMGTKASAGHEWIELYNNTSSDIDLTGWTIENSGELIADLSVSDAKYMNNSTVSTGGYYLIEWEHGTSTKSSISNIEGDFQKLGYNSLISAGGNLKLKDNSGTIIDEVGCSDGWFAGDEDTDATMERIDPAASGNLSSNWGTNDQITFKGKDFEGNDIYGTPRQQNSVFGQEVEEIRQTNKFLEVKNSPFFPLGDATGDQKVKSIIYYKVKAGSKITLRIYDTGGHLVRVLANSKETESATGNYTWAGVNEGGNKVAMGIYIVHIKAVDDNGSIKTGQATVVVGRNFNR